MKKFIIFLLVIFEPWVELYSQFFGDFLLCNFLQKTRSVSTDNCIRFSSIRLWCGEGMVST